MKETEIAEVMGYVTAIKSLLNDTKYNFVAIGYQLRKINEKKLYQETGHENIWEFARHQFGLSKSTTSRFMSINERFSAGGNSEQLDEKYKDFNVSQMSEMLTLTDGQIEQVTVETTVKEIRAMKPKPEKKQNPVEEPIEGQMTFEDYPDVVPEQEEKELLKCKKNPDYVKDNEIETSNNPDVGILECQPEIGEHKCLVYDEDDPEEENSVATSQQISEPEGQDAIHKDDPEYFNLRDVQFFLDKANQRLQECRQRPGMNVEAHRLQAIDVAAYSLLADSLQDATEEIKQMIQTAVRYYNLSDYSSADFYLYQARKILYETKEYDRGPIKPEVNELIPKQPELPVMKNNKSREEFIDNFMKWPIWIDCDKTRERSWKYDIDGDIAIVIRGKIRHVWENGKYSEKKVEYCGYEYYLLGVKIKYGAKGYEFSKNLNQTFSESLTNHSSLIEFLKKYQKGEVK